MVVISTSFTQDEAAMIIQRQVRRMLGLKTARLLCGKVVSESRDASSGFVYYYNCISGQSSGELPAFMNGRLCHASKYGNGSRLSTESSEVTASGSENMAICHEVFEKKSRAVRTLPRYIKVIPFKKN